MNSCAIVILNYNGEEMLKTFLPPVCMHSKSDIWIIDNASSDASLAFVQENFSSVGLIQLAGNLGYAGGYNKGLEQIQGKYKYYILLNSDVEVSPGWDLDLLSWMDDHPGHAALQPKILSWKERAKFDYAGAGGGFLDSYGYPYCRGRIWDTIEKDFGQYNDALDVDWASGACMMVRTAVFHELSGFDADFFAHMEEIDLCWRMRRAGWKIGYLGSVQVYHVGGATLDRASPHKLYLNIRNSLSMVYKNKSMDQFMRIFMVKSLIEHLAAFSYLLKGQFSHAKAIRRGYRDFEKKKRSIERSTPNSEEQQEAKQEGEVGFIFWNWKILGKKTFQEL